MQTTSQAGRDQLAGEEGVVTRAYKDVKGIWTIGVGHTAAAGAPIPKAGLSITRDEAMKIFATDLARYEARVRKAFGRDVPSTVFDGAVSFDFNTGAIDTASWVPLYLAGKVTEARKHFLAWNKPASLQARRGREAALVFDGTYSKVPIATGSSGAPAFDVSALQQDLIRLGFEPGKVDGDYGDETKAAVRAYQVQHPDLIADGVAGPATRAQIARDIATLADPSHPATAAVKAEAPLVLTTAAPAAAGKVVSAPSIAGLAVGALVLAFAQIGHALDPILNLFRSLWP
ncbi:hypothetical protein K32_23850 [Kaistia sp. 32K]|uniref:glycoside hydrolase family protein n=1 Tax=Kaistia sp. 32K TaxID=2795690 RepID=UPI0019152E4D|nr:peptidoglycan-binding protein [Kaistia sp. 32K]BCP53768.1 hypothetical protein K32_23850 [Kaistia sp. 32K]